MLYDLYKREVEERTERRIREETLRLAEEWDKLNPEEKAQRPFREFLLSNWDRPRKKRSIAVDAALKHIRSLIQRLLKFA